MNQTPNLMAKLSGIQKALVAAMNENVSHNRSGGDVLTRSNFSPDQIQHYFMQAASHVDALKTLLPELYGDFQTIETKPALAMTAPSALMRLPRCTSPVPKSSGLFAISTKCSKSAQIVNLSLPSPQRHGGYSSATDDPTIGV